MDARQTFNKVMERTMERSMDAPREVIAEGKNCFGNTIALMALVGPNSVQCVMLVAPDFTADFNLN